MFSKDVQKVALFKYENEDNVRKIFRDSNGCVGLRTIERWLKQIRTIETVDPSKLVDPSSTIRTKAPIQKVRRTMSKGEEDIRKNLGSRIEDIKNFNSSATEGRLKLSTLLNCQQPALTDEQKINRQDLPNGIKTILERMISENALFFDEKLFDIDGVYSS